MVQLAKNLFFIYFSKLCGPHCDYPLEGQSQKLYLWYSFAIGGGMAKAGETRQKILNIAQDAVLSKGFAATS